MTPPSGQWHARSADDVIAALGSDEQGGLSRADALARLADLGPNRLPGARGTSRGRRLLSQVGNPLIIVLLVSGFVTALLGDYRDSVVIWGVVVINAVIGYVQEGRAENALRALKSVLASCAEVVRDAERQEIDPAQLVPGDLIILEAGARVPADARVISAHNLLTDESLLTGESLPVEKQPDQVDVDAALVDLSCIAFAGTLVARGRGRAIVVETGARSQIGRITTLVGRLPPLSTPLTRRLRHLALQITAVVSVVAACAFAYGHWALGLGVLESFLNVVGIAVAAIPEGLPAIITVILAAGTRLMARNRAVIRRLPAVETLGSVSVICTDKTGTLTRNEMTVTAMMLPGSPASDIAISGAGYAPEGGFAKLGSQLLPANDCGLVGALICGSLCNDARVVRNEEGAWDVAGDPMEGALLVAALKADLNLIDLQQAFPRLDVIPFDSQRRYMATLHHDHGGRRFVLVKGAPETVLDLCGVDGTKKDAASSWARRVADRARVGERVLALARAEVPSGQTALDEAEIGGGLVVVGMACLVDPPREEVRESIAACGRAGVNVMMITGDHPNTAAAIADQVGLRAETVLTGPQMAAIDDAQLRVLAPEIDVVARASPEDKLRLVLALQRNGQFIAMTGDGLNDAPALRAADIGVAMGARGTDAARDAADIVLVDDNFATITGAVREGRVIYDNIKKALLFILPTNGGEAGLILVALLVGIVMPVTVGQILWVNLVTAVTLALAFAFEPGDPDVMSVPPRPAREPLITRPLAMRIVFVGALMTTIAFAAFEIEIQRGVSIEAARTTVVNVLVLAEMVYLFNVRSFTGSAFTTATLTGNRVALWACALLITLQLAFTYAAPMQGVFASAGIGPVSWMLAIALALAKFVAIEAEKWVWRSRGRLRF